MYPILKPLIKDLIKQKGLSYKELGHRIGISESGVKKLFQANDCSISRLNQIAKAIDLNLATLLMYAQQETPAEVLEIDPKAQAILLKRPQLMDVYWLLFIEDLSSAEILKRYKISKSALYKCLSELDRLKLIAWDPGDKITASPKRPFLIKPTGPMMQLWMRRFSESIMDDFFQNQEVGKAIGKEHYLTQRFLHLRSESILDLRQRLEGLIQEFSLRSTQEKSISKGRTLPVRIFTAYALGSIVKDLN